MSPATAHNTTQFSDTLEEVYLHARLKHCPAVSHDNLKPSGISVATRCLTHTKAGVAIAGRCGAHQKSRDGFLDPLRDTVGEYRRGCGRDGS